MPFRKPAGPICVIEHNGPEGTLFSISGKADPGATVDVWVHGDGGAAAVADGAGDWTVDFSAQTDLTYLSDGGSGQADGDGDATMLWWSSPRFWVAPADNWVQSRWPWTSTTTTKPGSCRARVEPSTGLSDPAWRLSVFVSLAENLDNQVILHVFFDVSRRP